MNTAKAYLLKYQELTSEVERISEEVAELRDKFESVQGVTYGEYITSSQYQSRTERDYELLEEKQTALAEVISRRTDTMIDIMSILGELEYPYGMVLFYRYIKLMQWDEISTTMNYTRSHLNSRIHSKALSLFKEYQQLNKV